MEYQRCTRCVMDNASDTSITFDENGYCNYCSDTLRRMPSEYFPDAAGRKKLDELMEKMKEDCRNDAYDCMVGISGGIDSAYILYLGYQYGLRMLAVHIDDDLDNPIATENIQKLIAKTGADLIVVKPDHTEYMDLLKSLFKASVPNLAIAQDNLIIKALDEYGQKNHIRYSLDGSNFAHECILERGTGVNSCDKRYILGIQKRFGEQKIKKLKLASLTDRYLKRKYLSSVHHIRPLNYVPYDLQEAIAELEAFCGFSYYGGKHYESILTRFLQCWYLPEKFGIDKRKSHFSSLIVSGQMTREEALAKLEEPLYPSEDLLLQDKRFLAEQMGITLEELEQYVSQPPKEERSYPHSRLNALAPIARKFRKFFE